MGRYSDSVSVHGVFCHGIGRTMAVHWLGGSDVGNIDCQALGRPKIVMRGLTAASGQVQCRGAIIDCDGQTTQLRVGEFPNTAALIGALIKRGACRRHAADSEYLRSVGVL